jgi:hypothetical protein
VYIGTDGHLYAKWWNGNIAPIPSATVVDDGLWHHVTLTGYPNGQTLFVDNQAPIYLPGSIDLSQINPTNLNIGAGYTGGSWPMESHYHPGDATGTLEFFRGQVADVVYSYPGGP